MKRVGLVLLMHESNTFIRQPTTRAHFETDLLLTGAEVGQRMQTASHEFTGAMQALSETKGAIQVVPLFAGRALPYGPIESKTADELVETLLQCVRQAGPLDGIYAAVHGAAVAEQYLDFDGYWLGRLRELIGPNIPLMATLDLHANVSPAMVSACDVLVAYRTNPHLDQWERGRDVGRLMCRWLLAGKRYRTHAAFPSMAVNIEAQLTNDEPCRSFLDSAFARGAADIPSAVSVVLGFPYSDVPEMGACVIQVTELNTPSCVDEIAKQWFERREQFRGHLINIDEALEQAKTCRGPVCLLDMGDNVGGGSPGDSTHLLHAVIRKRLFPIFVCLYDPQAVSDAIRLGVGGVAHFQVGGADGRDGEPVETAFRVRSLHYGRFEESLTRHGGMKYIDQGPTAILESPSDIIVMATSRRMAPFSLEPVLRCGLRPSDFRVMIAKGVHAPVAAYGPVCERLIRVNTPGVTTADMTTLPYIHRRRPLWPFEEEV
jgi:microcystin degradation protein MlrC